ncbi:MAG TPA: cytochrome c family protein [Candidatus Sulfopaludibacter sp.]|nr:cytochrome c family protein [Candidatus Sulfopaludibacter sp.]
MAGLLLTVEPGRTQGVQHLTITQPGGMPGTPVMTGIQNTTNGVTLTWDGPSGYYHLYQKSGLQTRSWQALGNFNLNRIATVTNIYSNDFFRVAGPAPSYAGAQVCMECHADVHSTYLLTAHAQAFASLQQIHQDTNSSCLACHTVGYGLPTGFTNAVQTPQLEGVQCENCHGPAANHAANPGDPTVVPRVEMAAQMCGGCHSARLTPSEVVAHHPLGFGFEDWSASPHSAVVPDVLQSMASSASSISSCGRCHSGSAREALWEGENPSTTLTNDYNVAITCAVCHDAHQTYVWTNVLNGVITFTNQLTENVAYITNDGLGAVYTNQLRNPYASTNDFVLTTSEVFSNAYNPNINVCAQCHNDRGSAWTDTSRSPHHSLQYNMLLGTVGQLTTGPSPGYPSTHSRLEMQCTECHMQTDTNNPSGHTFEVATYQLCLNCHSDPTGLVQFATMNISNQIQQTQALLDMWATNAAPAELRTNYGTLAWEYTTPGDLSATTNSGPNAAQQALISTNILQARFDLYLVYYDGSYGVHNAPYDSALLTAAESFIESQLYQ